MWVSYSLRNKNRESFLGSYINFQGSRVAERPNITPFHQLKTKLSCWGGSRGRSSAWAPGSLRTRCRSQCAREGGATSMTRISVSRLFLQLADLQFKNHSPAQSHYHYFPRVIGENPAGMVDIPFVHSLCFCYRSWSKTEKGNKGLLPHPQSHSRARESTSPGKGSGGFPN